VDNREPTKQVIGEALKLAKKYVSDGRHLNEALALATTSAQCQGFMGFKVFAASQAAVKSGIGDRSLHDFCTKAKPEDQIDALEFAYRLVMS
jgi:hypothetical protein